jgi:PD-(D/E)XK nuclease superfamily
MGRGGLVAYNQSKIKQWRRCQRQFAYRYDYPELLGEEGEMVRKVVSKPLYRGTWLHALLEAHHRQWAGLSENNDWEEVHEEFTEEFDKLFDEEKEELGNLPDECERVFRSYLRYWKKDTETYTVAKLKSGQPAIEFVLEQRLHNKIDDLFKCRIDLMVEDAEYGGLWIWDHKWVGKVPPSEERMMSPQSNLYVWAARKAGYDVRGFLNNYGRTKAPTIPRVLKNGTLSVAKRMDTDVVTYLQAVKDLHGDRARDYVQHVYRDHITHLKNREVLWFRRERFPVNPEQIKQSLMEFLLSIKSIERRTSPRYAPRTYNFTCKRGCEYHDLCVSEFMGLDIDSIIKKQFTFEEDRYGKEQDLLAD